jgi:tetratricopeptide (TPR) repeat protein
MRIGRVLLWGIVGVACGWAQSVAVREAVASMQRGDFVAAEQKLRVEVAGHPEDGMALSLLGAALDNLKRLPEADAIHKRAVAKAPRSVDVLNNYAAHLWFAGDLAGARKVYLQVVGLDPAQFNANLQLARQALQEKKGAEALGYLEKIPPPGADAPQVLLGRFEGMLLAGRGAEELEQRLARLAGQDAGLAFAAGSVLWNARQFGRAEPFFEAALKAEPSNFNVLYDLGVVANSAGHHGRAKEVLEAALRQQPRNADVLFGLATADEALHEWETAVQLLAQAAKVAPERADIWKMIALTATELDALDDAAAAWDRYMKLQPGDDVARRERGYNLAKMGKLEEATKELAWFAGRHPEDVRGHYEYAQALRTVDIPQAITEYGKALARDPKFVAALSGRGSLYYQEGNPAAALPDLEAAARISPDDGLALDRLGQTYQALDRVGDAVRTLRRAAELAPQDSKTLLHFARALADAGETAESKVVMDRFRALGPEKRTAVPAGFVEYAGMSAEQRQADYRGRLEKVLREHPEDSAARVEYLKLLLARKEFERADAAGRELVAAKAGPALLLDAGRALLAAGRNGPATELLRLAGKGGEVEWALATFRGGDRRRGFELLSAAGATGSVDRFRFLRAQAEMREASGQRAGALESVRELARLLPEDRTILVMLAAALELDGKGGEADTVLDRIQDRWPEWYPGWLARAAVWKARGREREAAEALRTAGRLGAADGNGWDLLDYLTDKPDFSRAGNQ